MNGSDDDWNELSKRLNFCAVCMCFAAPPEESVKRHFVACANFGTMLLFDSFGRLHYSVPKALGLFLDRCGIFDKIPECVLALMPEPIVRECFTVPLTFRDETLVVGMVHPVFDVLNKIRFVLNQSVVAVKIDDSDFEQLLRSYS